MNKLLRILGVLFVALILLAGAVAAFIYWKPNAVRSVFEGETRLLDYLGAQVVGIANAQLVPDLSYETIRYDAPYSLGLGGVRLVAPDGTEVLDLGRMDITLAKVPARGEPIQIASITIADGAARLIRDPATGGLRGLSPIVEPRAEREKKGETSPEFKLSNVLVLKRVELRAIDLIYDAGDGSTPMRLDGLRAGMDIVPDAAGEGWYTLALTSGRQPGLELDLNGALNIDSFELRVDRLTAATMLDDQTRTSLPQQLSALVEQYQLRGALRAEASGTVPLLDPASGDIALDATLTDGRAVLGEYQIPISSLTARGTMNKGIVGISPLNIEALGGSARVNARIELEGDASADWSIQGMRLRELLASRQPDQPPALAGVINAGGTVRARLDAPRETLSGSGQIDLTKGRLANIPVITNLVEVIEVTGILGDDTYRDTFKSPYTLSPKGITLDGFEFTTPAIAARGTGTIGLDGTLDMRVNGGPVEALQRQLGKLGQILGSVTDGLVKYRIRGTVSEPNVSVQPLGIGG